jgi:hypothetical protein
MCDEESFCNQYKATRLVMKMYGVSLACEDGPPVLKHSYKVFEFPFPKKDLVHKLLSFHEHHSFQQ